MNFALRDNQAEAANDLLAGDCYVQIIYDKGLHWSDPKHTWFGSAGHRGLRIFYDTLPSAVPCLLQKKLRLT
jgi:hypothetical protein